MSGEAHLALGVATGLTAAFVLFPEHIDKIAFVIPCAIGSLYPDIDIATSKMGKITRPFSTIIGHIFGHRGFIHTPINMCLATLLLYVLLVKCDYYAPTIMAAGFFLGYFLHLFQDTFTAGGIAWFFPLPYTIHFTTLSSKHRIAMTIITAMLFLIITMLIYAMPGPLQTLYNGFCNILLKIPA